MSLFPDLPRLKRNFFRTQSFHFFTSVQEQTKRECKMFLQPFNSTRPPTVEVMPHRETLIFTIGTLVPYAGAILYGFFNLLVKHDSLLLLFMIGGSLCVIPEPVMDSLIHCRHGPKNDFIFYYHRTTGIPWFMLASYGSYVGGISYYWYTKFREQKNPMTKSRLWILFAIAYAASFGLEIPVNNTPLQDYWGAQPYKIWGMPWEMPAINAAMPLVVASLVNVLGEERLRGWKKLVVVLIPPTGNVIGTGAVAWPVWWALDLDAGPHVSEPAAVTTVVLVAITIWIISLQFDKPSVKEKVR